MAKTTRKKTTKKANTKFILPKWAKITAVAVIVLIAIGVIFAAPFLTTKADKKATLLLKRGTSNKEVADSLASCTSKHFADKVMELIEITHGDLSNRHGAFTIKEGESALSVANHLRRGDPDEVKVTINSIRTKEDLAKRLANRLMMSKEDMLKALNDKELCAKYDKTPDNITGIFLPDTYQFLWDVEPAKLIEHMAKYSNNFWNGERKEKAEKIGLTPDEVVTLASIVEGETTKADEKGKVARLYLNRLQNHIKLQADPTVKFALQNFALRRITFEDCSVQSPWNTYYVEGLPPGPICIPDKASIDAVLDAPKHNYIYMCAKEDFSGYHNFAETL
ncbi:MAG: endolytic transglycosylase MltG, partial [Muribaculaceae bacterium]|nr:endolytic transglycosylase MltG [Muribaculaceae bacterium]